MTSRRGDDLRTAMAEEALAAIGRTACPPLADALLAVGAAWRPIDRAGVDAQLDALARPLFSVEPSGTARAQALAGVVGLVAPARRRRRRHPVARRAAGVRPWAPRARRHRRGRGRAPRRLGGRRVLDADRLARRPARRRPALARRHDGDAARRARAGGRAAPLRARGGLRRAHGAGPAGHGPARAGAGAEICGSASRCSSRPPTRAATCSRRSGRRVEGRRRRAFRRRGPAALMANSGRGVAGLDPGGLDDDVDAGVEVHAARVDHEVVARRLARIPAVELDRHVGAELVLPLLALGGPVDVDAALLGGAFDPLLRAGRPAGRGAPPASPRGSTPRCGP